MSKIQENYDDRKGDRTLRPPKRSTSGIALIFFGIVAVLLIGFAMLSPAPASDALSALDTDQNGCVTAAEIKTFYVNPPNPLVLTKEQVITGEDGKKLIAWIEANHGRAPKGGDGVYAFYNDKGMVNITLLKGECGIDKGTTAMPAPIFDRVLQEVFGSES